MGKKKKKKFFLFYDIEDGDDYSTGNPPYRGASSEKEARRISANWNGPNGLWVECELDADDNPLHMKPRPDIELIRTDPPIKSIFTFREGDLANGAGGTLGSYDSDHIPLALSHLRAYFGCVHFELDGNFISDHDLAILITGTHRNLLITTNNHCLFYVDCGELNKPFFEL